MIALPKAQLEKAKALVAAEEQSQKAIYGTVETTLQLNAEETAVPAQVWSQADTEALVDLLLLLHTGVFAMNQHLSTLPDLSANLATLQLDGAAVKVEYFPRSSSNERLEEFTRTLPVYTRVTGFALHTGAPFSAWKENTHSRLLPVIRSTYERVLGQAPKVEAIHGGLETGLFYAVAPQLDIVSVGPDTHAIHSPEESVDLDTCAQLARIIAETLTELTK